MREIRVRLRWARWCVVCLLIGSSTVLAADDGAIPAQNGRAFIHVGIDDGDLRGSDDRVLQAAVDYVAGLGGGTVRIGAGRYSMRNALRLRDGVRVEGVPGATILAACDGAETPLACDGDCNERQITLVDPGPFRVGDGVSIQDESSGGFMVTTATLIEQVDAHTFRISAPLYLDYLVSKNATARLAAPVVGGWGVKDVVIADLTIEGNADNRGYLDGCRGGGIYLFECRNVAIRDCVVRNYNGDGISFQVSEDVVVEGCKTLENRGLGLHPGSGSQRPILRRNESCGNARDGLFVCWRVKHGLFEDNQIHANGGAGISIGHKDTDNRFISNSITGNGGAGVLFREELEAMGAHRNVFEGNRILDNGLGGGGRVGVEIRGPHHELTFRGNTIGLSGAASPDPGVGILKGKQARSLLVVDNEFLNVRAAVEDSR